jgi:hypothetical protein
MSKRSIIAALTFILLSSLAFGAEGESLKQEAAPSEERSRRFGIGLIVGSPTGVTAKYYFRQSIAVDAAAGWSIPDKLVQVHLGILNNTILFKKTLSFPLVLYHGAGVKFNFTDNFSMGFRIPIGMLYNFKDLTIKDLTIDLFMEFVPVVYLIPDTGLDLDSAIGARYYFKMLGHYGKIKDQDNLRSYRFLKRCSS